MTGSGSQARWALATVTLAIFWAGALAFGRLAMITRRTLEVSSTPVATAEATRLSYWLWLGLAFALLVTGPLLGWDVATRRRHPLRGGRPVLLVNVGLQCAVALVAGAYVTTHLEPGGGLLVGLGLALGLPLWATFVYLVCRRD